MGLVAEWFFQELVVQFCDGRVLVGFSDLFRFIDVVYPVGPLLKDLPVKTVRLSAAADTTAGTGHDFDKVVEDLATIYLFDEFSGVLPAIGDGYLEFSPVEVDRSFFDAFQASCGVKIDLRKGLSGSKFIS